MNLHFQGKGIVLAGKKLFYGVTSYNMKGDMGMVEWDSSIVFARCLSIFFALIIILLSLFRYILHGGEIVTIGFLVLGFSIISLYLGQRIPIIFSLAYFLFEAFTDPSMLSKTFFLTYFLIFSFFYFKVYGLGQIFGYMVGIMGYSVMVSHLTGLLPYPSLRIPPLDGLFHVMAAMSLLSLYPNEGIVAPLHSKYAGGYIARKLLPLLVMALLVMGPIILLLRGYFPYPAEVLLLAVAVAISIPIITVTVHNLNITDQARAKSHKRAVDAWHFFKGVIENTEDAIAVLNRKGEKVYENKKMKKISPKIQDYWAKLKKEKRPVPIKALTTDNSHFTGWIIPRYHENKFDGAILSLTEVTDLIRMQKQLKKNIKERDALLRELHHRVKNTLQLIISLINLQAQETDKNTRKAFLDIQNRIMTMAIVHEALYEIGTYTKIDMGKYIKRLVDNLKGRFGARNIKFNIDCRVKFNMETSMPLALLINELLANSLTHTLEGKIKIKTKETKEGHQLIIADNRSGAKAPTCIDSPLVKALTHQLDGTLQTKTTEEGIKIIITFKELEYKERI